MFPLFFGFTLVGAEKAINSFERVTFRAEGKNSSGFTSPRVLEKELLLGLHAVGITAGKAQGYLHEPLAY